MHPSKTKVTAILPSPACKTPSKRNLRALKKTIPWIQASEMFGFTISRRNLTKSPPFLTSTHLLLWTLNFRAQLSSSMIILGLESTASTAGSKQTWTCLKLSSWVSLSRTQMATCPNRSQLGNSTLTTTLSPKSSTRTLLICSSNMELTSNNSSNMESARFTLLKNLLHLV